MMTPITWSFVQLFIDEAMSASAMPGFDMVGNIGGRFYMNLTLIFAIAGRAGEGRISAVENVFGRFPAGLDMPRRILRPGMIVQVVPRPSGPAAHCRYVKELRAFLADSPDGARTCAPASPPWRPDRSWPPCRAGDRAELVTSSRMLQTASRQGGASCSRHATRCAGWWAKSTPRPC